ncbi:MAG: NAD(P)/FAD-dependent oxidoreductase, partial [Runella slithyformis]
KLLKMNEVERGNITLHEGVSIKKIDRVARTVTDQNGQIYPYDRLIVATGSRPNAPRDYSIELDGVFTMRTRHDADRLVQHLAAPKPAPRKRVVVVGGGLLGMEMAASLNQMGHLVTIVDRSSRLMSRQLDSTASALLHEEVTDRHIDILYNDEVKYLTECDGIVAGTRLMSGRTLDADVVIVAMGTMPNLELGREAGLLVNRGICVNAYLQTSDPLIHALGEVAEFEGGLFGITMAAEEQATALCHFLNGDVQRYYRPTVLMNILKMEGFDLCSMGQTEIPANGPGAEYEEVIFTDRSQRYYKKCVIKGDRLVGAILLGDKSEFIEYKALIQNQTELSDKRLKLLRSGQSGPVLKGKVVCACNNVGEGNLGDAIAAGCADFQVLCQQTGAGMGCGSCRLEVKALFEKNTLLVK